MKMTVTRPGSALNQIAKSLCVVSVTAFVAFSASAQVASGTTGIDATGNATSEMAACKNGSTQQSRETCMTEVRNAAAAKRAGRIDSAAGQYQANSLKRCEVLEGENKVACVARVLGYGSPRGSVAGGGVLTQVETVVVPQRPGVINIQPQTKSDTIVVIPAK
jgi:hypothetical protein